MEQPTQLTAEQIQKLFAFVRTKFVSAIDLQYELVDHLASGIETQLNDTTDKSFEEALIIEYKKFPITGFSKFKEAKIKVLTKYWNKKIWSCIGTYLTLPKILMTILIFILVYQLCSYIPFIIISIIGFILSIMSMRHLGKYFKLSHVEPYLVIYIMKNNLYSMVSVAPTIWGSQLLMVLLNSYSQKTEYISTPDNIILVLFLSLLLTFQIIILFPISNGEFKQLLLDEVEKKYQHLNIKLSNI